MKIWAVFLHLFQLRFGTVLHVYVFWHISVECVVLWLCLLFRWSMWLSVTCPHCSDFCTATCRAKASFWLMAQRRERMWVTSGCYEYLLSVLLLTGATLMLLIRLQKFCIEFRLSWSNSTELGRLHKRASTEWWIMGHWLGSVLCVCFNALTLLMVEGRPGRKTLVPLIPKFSLLEQVGEGNRGEFANSDLSGKQQLNSAVYRL